MEPVDRFGSDDGASMRANNTSAFNCRYVAGTTKWSEHSYGRAIDINPLHNPYVRNGSVDPPEGATWADRRSEEHTSELQSLMRISYAVFCLKKKSENK